METQGNQQAKRPLGISILLILSFIGGGCNFFSSMFTFMAFPMLGEVFEKSAELYSSIFPQEAIDSAMTMLDVNRYYYLIIALLNAASFIGALKMWNFKKEGFHIYAIAQICMLIAISLLLYPMQETSALTSDLMFTGLFILVYYLYMKRIEILNNVQGNKNNGE